MPSYQCLINKSYKKVSYPVPIILEPMFMEHLQPLPLVIDEVKSGEIMIIEFFENKVMRLFLADDNNLNQIFGEPVINQVTLKLKCIDYKKKLKIEDYIKGIYRHLKICELISSKNDLMDLENEIMKYLLTCKSKEKFDLRKIRSLIFKSCKNHKFAEKIYGLVKTNPYDYFSPSESIVTVDFSSLTVQIEHGS